MPSIHPIVRLAANLIALVALLYSFAPAASAVALNGPNEIPIPGYSAKIVFHDTKAALSIVPQTTNVSRFYTIKFSHLVESDASESTPFQQASFDQAVVYTPWSTLQNDSNNLIQTMNMSTSVSMAGGAKLPIRVRYFVFHNEAVVQQGTESVSVANRSLKFTFEMDSWPFKDTTNYVFLHTAITSSDVVSYSALLRQSGQVRRLSIHPAQNHNDSLFIDFPITGILDKANHNVNVKIQSGDAPVAGEYIDLVFAFPYFARGLSYDPDVGLEMLTNGTPLEPAPPTMPLALILTLVAIAVAVGILGLFLAIQSYRRWRERKRYARMI